jgi:hypothetical protein
MMTTPWAERPERRSPNQVGRALLVPVVPYDSSDQSPSPCQGTVITARVGSLEPKMLAAGWQSAFLGEAGDPTRKKYPVPRS